jgi:hypothetical protein
VPRESYRARSSGAYRVASLKAATVERIDVESQAEQGTDITHAEQPQVSKPEINSSQVRPTQADGTRLSSAPVKPLSSSLKPSRNTVYLYPEDLTKLRQLSGYASTEHGIRANDSMIVRAALSLIETDVRFLHALKDAVLSDRRRTAKQP